jgi:hypothetical protein
MLSVTVRSTPGETPVVGQVNYDGNGHFAGMDVNGSSFLTVPSADGDGLPTQIRNWQWGGADPGLASADLARTVLNPALGDPIESDRVTMVFRNADDGLATTMSAGELSLCAYPDLGSKATVKRPMGVRIGADGSVAAEAHLYYEHPDGSVPIMIVVNGQGDVVVGVSYIQPEGEDPPAAYHFFEAWPSNAEPGTWMPIYSETSGGTPYIMGSVSPKGEYRMFQYEEGGEIEAIVQMNEVDLRGADSIPAVSEWGVIVMTLLVLSAGTLVFIRRWGLQFDGGQQ